MECYLDNSATTQVFPEVAEKMKTIMCENYGNPSSMHMMGVNAEKELKEAKDIFAKILKCDVKNLYFTSCGSESDNLALIGCAMANKRAGMHLITTKVEHPAILQTMQFLEEQGFEVTYLPVDQSGRVSLEELGRSIRPDTILVSIMHTNNEIGSVMPIEEAGELIKSINPATLFHVDAVQGFGKAVILPKRMKIDLLSISGHKIHGPKGMGLLYVGDKVKIKPILFGGGQQGGLRSGTENVPGIAGMALAASLLYKELAEDTDRLMALKKKMIEGLLALPDVQVNGLMTEEGNLRSGSLEDGMGQNDLPDAAVTGTAPHIVSASFPGVRSEVLLHTLEDAGIYVSAGSACSSHKPQPSATLTAIGLKKELLDCTIRFSFSVHTKEEEIDYTLQILGERLPILQRYRRH